MEQPTPPELPPYALDGINDSRTISELRELAEYCNRLADYKERSLDLDEAEVDGEIIADASGEKEPEGDELSDYVQDADVEELENTKGVALQSRHLTCGDDCAGCPHGPYLYALFRDETGEVTSEYKGKA